MPASTDGHPLKSPFLFTVCQVGAEPALKNEIAREYPDVKFSYSRPGFVTFKAPAPLTADFELRSVFARAYGLSLGKVKASDPAGRLVEVARSWITSGLAGPPIRLHLWERDRYAPGEEPLGFEPGAWVDRNRAGLQGAGIFAADETPGGPGELVFDVVGVEENEWWYGAHLHSAAHSPAPGGAPRIPLPEEAPSRAYLKLEEALAWSGAPARAGDQAVEIGSAPGGAAFALLKRGIHVVGIDPGEMDPRILRFRGPARFGHIASPVAAVPREDLPASVEWLLADMNVEPRVSLYAVDRLASRMKDSLLGLLLTIKLNQWKMAAEIPAMLEHVKAIGMAKVRATQLAHNRREIFIYGLTRKGLARERAR